MPDLGYADGMTSDASAALRPVVVLADTSHLESVVAPDRVVFGGLGDRDRYARVVERGDCFAAVVDDAALGFAVYDTFLHGHGLPEAIGVHPDHRREGIAGALVEPVQRHCPTDRLSTATSADNIAMLKTAVALGFVPAGHIDGIDEPPRGLHHYRIYFDDAGCYDVLATSLVPPDP